MPRPNQGASLKANEHGIYEIRWTEGHRSKRVSTRSGNLQEAQRIFAGWILESDRSKNSAVSVNDILDTHREERIASGKIATPNKPDDDTELRRIKILRPFFGEMLVADISHADVAEYVRRRTSGKLGRKVVGATVRRELVVLIAAVNRAAKAKRISRDSVPSIDLPAGSAPRDYWLTDAQLDKLMEAAQKPHERRLSRAYVFIAIARYTAARKHAIERLTWFQVDFDRGMIDFRLPGERVTKKRKAIVPIADALLPILKRAKEEARTGHVLRHPGAVRKAFATAATKAGLPDATPHTLRHSWATLAAQRGVSMFDIAGVLGDTITTVQKSYAHHAPDYLRGAVNSGRNPGITPDPGASRDQQRPTTGK